MIVDTESMGLKHPFIFGFNRSFFSSSELESVNCLVRSLPWFRHVSSFYDQHEYQLIESRDLDFLSIFSNNFIAKMIDQVRQSFGCDFFDFVSMSFHKLVSGQEIGIHSDTPLPGYETHRVLVNISEQGSFTGGEFSIYLNGQRKVIPLSCNDSIHFELNESSLHSVSKVESGTRFTLVISLWERTSEVTKEFLTELASRQLWHAYELEISRYVDVLRVKGYQSLDHSGKTLFNHLYNTYRIVKSWGCDENVQLAALTHSVLNPVITKNSQMDLDSLKAFVGIQAARLVYYYNALSESEIFSFLSEPSKCPLNPEILSDLLCIVAANTLEQVKFLGQSVASSECLTLLEYHQYLPQKANFDLLNYLGSASDEGTYIGL